MGLWKGRKELVKTENEQVLQDYCPQVQVTMIVRL